MGLFSSLFRPKSKSATTTFDLTEEETLEVNKAFDLLKGYVVHSSVADKLKHGLIASGLANYATDRIMLTRFDSQQAERVNNINKAIAAIGKAYSIYQLHIYLYDLACYFELKDMRIESMKMFERFLARQEQYKADQLDQIFLSGRNVNEAKALASQKLRKQGSG